MIETLAQIILKAAKVHETYEGNQPKKDLEGCCQIAADDFNEPKVGRLVYLALDGWWGDTIDWAQEVLK